MSLRLFAAPEGQAEYWELDTAGVGTDRASGGATAVVTRIESHPVHVSTGSESKLRKLVQWFTVLDDLSVEVTPIVNGVLRSAQALVVTLAAANGDRQRLEVPVSVVGSRFAVRVRILSGVGGAIGSGEFRMIPKRSGTGGD